jgi:hypothetical protein
MCNRPGAAIPPHQTVRHDRQDGDVMDTGEVVAALGDASGGCRSRSHEPCT